MLGIGSEKQGKQLSQQVDIAGKALQEGDVVQDNLRRSLVREAR
jgi:hypothetical protein